MTNKQMERIDYFIKKAEKLDYTEKLTITNSIDSSVVEVWKFNDFTEIYCIRNCNEKGKVIWSYVGVTIHHIIGFLYLRKQFIHKCKAQIVLKPKSQIKDYKPAKIKIKKNKKKLVN